MDKLKAHHYPVKLMGSGFVVTAVDKDPQKAWDGIRAAVSEIERIEHLISSWKPNSQTSSINRCAGQDWIRVDGELFDLIARSIKVSELTAGAFDISGTLARYYWNFDGSESDFLPIHKIEELRSLINYKNISLDSKNKGVYLKTKGMKIGFGGIGKGYAAYSASVKMQELGIKSGLINASGDLMCWGHPPGRESWGISIPNPNNQEKSLIDLEIPYGSVVTSGNHENYCLIEGVRYSHIVDPRTGVPALGTNNVTVICPNPEFGDALATGLSVLGPEEGIKLVNQLEGVECIIIDAQQEIHFSNKLLKTAA